MTDEKRGCYGCENRTIGCHSNCEKYNEYKEKADLINKNRREYMECRAYTKIKCQEYRRRHPKRY